jgi:hypothetical protein
MATIVHEGTQESGAKRFECAEAVTNRVHAVRSHATITAVGHSVAGILT